MRRAIDVARSGGFVLLPREVVTSAQPDQVLQAVPEGAWSLTGREREILLLIAGGHSNSTVARILWIAEQTVTFHLANVYRKLGVRARADAIQAARSLGLT